jgi:UDP-N-acetylmuramoylalanine--D-glutamate ligase
MKYLQGQHILILGLGSSGLAMARWCAEMGAEVTVADTREAPANLVVLNTELPEVHFKSGPLGVNLIEGTSVRAVFASPGLAPAETAPVIEAAQALGLWVGGELSLFVQALENLKATRDYAPQVLAITGTNGKTTVTALTGQLMARAGKTVKVAGNIGPTLLDTLRLSMATELPEVWVLELSSFQLDNAGSFEPSAATVLNITQDHLDWHGSVEAYRAAKGAVYHNTRKSVFYSRIDPVTEALVRDANVKEGCEAIGFGLVTPDTGELGTIDGILVDRAFVPDRRNNAQELTTVDHLAELGFATPHMILNILAASGMALSVGASAVDVAAGLDSFQLDHHRCETVTENGGVTWVDDSKATNAHAANASLRAFPSLVWIVGGMFKGTQIDELVQAHRSRLRAVIAIGVDRDEPRRVMAAWAPDVPFIEIDTDDVMNAAVSAAALNASPGDTVLLAPAAASMDQFVDYADRGRQFQAAVRAHVGLTDD